MFVQHENKYLRFAVLSILIGLFSACGPRELTLEERVEQAEAASQAGKTALAIEKWEALTEEYPLRVDFMESLAFAYMEAGEELMAGFTFSRAADEAESQPEFHLYAAESFRTIEDNEAARDQYEAYLGKRPNDRNIWIALAESRQEAGNRSGALEAWLRAERLRADGEIRIRLGKLYLEADNLPQAQSWFARALDQFPATEEDALFGLFETALRSRRTADAEKLLKEIDALNPMRVNESHLASARPQIEQWREHQDEAARAAEAIARTPAATERPASERRPEDSEATERDDESVAETGPTAVTTDESAPSRPERPSRPSTDRLEQARAANNSGNHAEAVRLYRQLLVDDPSSSVIWRELSEAAHQAGDLGWSQAAANEAMRLDPENPRNVLQYIRVSSDQWTPDRWISEMEAAYRQFPRTPEIVLYLARGYLSLQNNRRNARLLFDEFLRIAPPDHPERPMVEAERNRL
jgi:tetratricopeptide (TPR) repeat protein